MTTRGSVKNKAPAPIQITSEQLLREAWDQQKLQLTHKSTTSQKAPLRFHDLSELHIHQAQTRKNYEDRLMRNRLHHSLWLQYARYETSQHNLQHARSVYERALEQDSKHFPFWIDYAEMEMNARMVNHARNIFERAVEVLPREMKIWLKFAYMEEVLGNVKEARRVFRRGIEWRLGKKFYKAYLGFEERHRKDAEGGDKGVGKEREEMEEEKFDGVEEALELWCRDWPDSRVYERLALWEQGRKRNDRARQVYEEGFRRLQPPSQVRAEYYREFARFEQQVCGEHERANAIIGYAKKVHPDMDIGSW